VKWFVILVPIYIAFAATACGEISDEQGNGFLAVEEAQVLAAEDAYVAAEINRDASALDRLVDDKFVYNAADGTTSGKEELIRSVLSMNMTDQTISERMVVVEGDVAVIFGTAELRFEGTGEAPRLSKLRYTSVYIKRSGQWRMLALQMQPRASR
jgi:ketosteroid isomerase-like protein